MSRLGGISGLGAVCSFVSVDTLAWTSDRGGFAAVPQKPEQAYAARKYVVSFFVALL